MNHDIELCWDVYWEKSNIFQDILTRIAPRKMNVLINHKGKKSVLFFISLDH